MVFLLAGVIAARLYLGVWLLDYVNGVLNNIEGYKGSVESIDIDLYRGAYRIHHLKLYKKTGHSHLFCHERYGPLGKAGLVSGRAKAFLRYRLRS